jgi:hypothetical protein
MLNCVNSFPSSHLNLFRFCLIILALAVYTLNPLHAQSTDINNDGFQPIAGKPEDIGAGETTKTKGPTLFGVLQNTHWNIASRCLTHYISKGLMLDDNSIQTELRFLFDNPFVDASWNSQFFLDNFTNFPLDSPLREIDYAIGVDFHLFNLCDDIKVDTELAYNYYTFPGPPQAPYQSVNRQNEFYIQLNTQWDKLVVLLWFYYELACIQSTTILNIAYETPLTDIHCCLPKRFSLLTILESGYANLERPNGDQHQSSGLIVDHYSYIQLGTYLKYSLNKCAQIQTGILYTTNNGSSSNYKSQQSTWTWNVIEFDVSY